MTDLEHRNAAPETWEPDPDFDRHAESIVFTGLAFLTMGAIALLAAIVALLKD